MLPITGNVCVSVCRCHEGIVLASQSPAGGRRPFVCGSGIGVVWSGEFVSLWPSNLWLACSEGSGMASVVRVGEVNW